MTTPQGVEARQLLTADEYGWLAIDVKIESFEALIHALDRASRKGYMPDAMANEWEAFDWRYRRAATPPAPPVPAQEPSKVWYEYEPYASAVKEAAKAIEGVDMPPRLAPDTSPAPPQVGQVPQPLSPPAELAAERPSVAQIEAWWREAERETGWPFRSPPTSTRFAKKVWAAALAAPAQALRPLSEEQITSGWRNAVPFVGLSVWREIIRWAERAHRIG